MRSASGGGGSGSAGEEEKNRRAHPTDRAFRLERGLWLNIQRKFLKRVAPDPRDEHSHAGVCVITSAGYGAVLCFF